MSDSISLNDLFARFNLASVFDRFERTEGANREQTDETSRGGRRRGRLRAAFARSRRARPAVLVEFSQRARAAGETQGAEEPERAAAPRDRAVLRQQFRQAVQAFRNVNQPARAGAGGEARPGVVATPVGRRTAEQGGGPGAATPRRPGFQVGTPPAIVVNREPPRLDGIRMAASFEQTALGTALNQNQPPAAQPTNQINRGPLAQATGLNVAAGAQAPAGRTAPAGGLANAPARPGDEGAAATPDRRGTVGANLQAQGPMARIQERINNPGGAIATDRRSPLAAQRGMLAQGRVGANQLNRPPLVERVAPGRAEESAEASRAGVGTENIRRLTDEGNGPGNINRAANPDAAFNRPESPLARGNAALGREPNDNAGLRRGTQVQTGPVMPAQTFAPPAVMNAPAGGEVGRAAAPAPGIAPPANPIEEAQTQDYLRNEAAAPLEGTNQPDQARPRQADLRGAPAPELERPPANPTPPAPEPPETPAERAVALRTPPAEAADAELRATVPTPILQPPETAAAENPAAPPGAAANQAPGGLAGAEAAPPPRAGVPVEPREEAAPGATPARPAEGRPPRARIAEAPANEEGPAAPAEERPGPGPAERPAAEEEGLAARATAAYEQQQLENRTNEPNEGRSVTELFIR